MQAGTAADPASAACRNFSKKQRASRILGGNANHHLRFLPNQRLPVKDSRAASFESVMQQMPAKVHNRL